MKHCPTCGNTYTNDGLVFCLEDGARLTSLSATQSSFDPQATLHISAEESPLPPTEAARPQGAPTIRQPATPYTVPPRHPQATSEPQAPPARATPAPTAKSTSPVIVAGITAIVVLLLVIAGIGIALLLRDSSSQGSNASAIENNNRNADSGTTNRNSSNTGNEGGAYNAANRANSNSANRNGSSTNPAGGAEAKVIRGSPLDESDLTALSGDELRRLRNAVYARHGRTFDSPDLQRYFETRPWYRPRSDYSEDSLTATDLANIKLIQTVESRRY